MDQLELLLKLLDSWNKPLVFVDSTHIIRYMNLPAREHYSKWGNVIGKSIFDCHNEKSSTIIKDVFEKLTRGEEEVIFTNSEKHRVYMRGVRDEDGRLLGYYERYEPPVGK